MKEQITQLLSAAVTELYSADFIPVLTRPDEQFGDYATNAAMQLAKSLGKNPREIAEEVCASLRQHDDIAEATVAGPGFINIRVHDHMIYNGAFSDVSTHQGSLLLEYSCPNAFKSMHVGHFYQTVLGDALGRVYERLGWKVHRVTFGGDVGRHVAMSMWSIVQELGGEYPDELDGIAKDQRATWLAERYVAGTKAFEEDEQAKQEILACNKRVYELHNNSDNSSDFARIYWTCRQWSYDAFNAFYESIQVKPFDRSIGESETFQPGLKIVRDNLGTIFSESDGAVILPEEKSGLHTRVFINSEGLPTYEAKDLGVIWLETQDFTYDKRIIMTGSEQKQYMQVVFAAQSLIDPELGAKQHSLSNGTVKFGDGKKMSSRLGNVTRAVDVLPAAMQAVQAKSSELQEQIALGAVKYTFLKSSIGGDIAFDLEQSVSTEGNSGPYLQYALVRARSILAKTTDVEAQSTPESLDQYERRLASWLSRYSEILYSCQSSSSLHELCQYLYELSQVFNQFYENSRVIDDPRSAIRLPLVRTYEQTLADGLKTLGIPSPQEM